MRTLPFFTYNEIPAGNLQNYENDYDFLICASANLAFNDRYGEYFNKRYNLRERVLQTYGEITWKNRGLCLRLPHVFILIVDPFDVKEMNLDRLREALIDAEVQGLRKVFIPRWEQPPAWNKFKDVLMNTIDGDIEMLVVYAVEDDGILIIMDPDLEKQNFGKDRKELSKKYY